MTEKEKLTQKLKEISTKLTEIVADTEIKVIINSSDRTISFLSHSFSIPAPSDKEKYIATWSEIFTIFEKEKENIKRLKEIEVFKKQEELNKKKNEEEKRKLEEIRDLSYTQNLSYIQNIIEKNSDFSEDKEEVEIKEEIKEEKKITYGSNFKYGIKVSETDDLQNSDWFDIEDDKIDFVILTAMRNGKIDRKFKTYVKKCRDHGLCCGALFHGTATNIGEVKGEILEIVNLLEIYEIKGPIIYEINNKAVNLANDDQNKIELKNIYKAVMHVINELTKKGYSSILNVDLNTISILVNEKIMTTKDVSLIYNVLPSQTMQMDESCQIIEFNPKNDYDKLKISDIHFKERISNK